MCSIKQNDSSGGSGDGSNYYYLDAKHTKFFTHIYSFNKLLCEVLYLFSFYRWENWGTKGKKLGGDHRARKYWDQCLIQSGLKVSCSQFLPIWISSVSTNATYRLLGIQSNNEQ